MVTGSLGVWKDEEGAKEAAPLTAWVRCIPPFHGVPLITCHNLRSDSQESNMPFPTQLAPCVVMKRERRDLLAGMRAASGTVKLSQKHVKQRRLAE